MLPRKNRLTRFFRSDKAVFEPGVKIFYVQNSLDFSRFGISIQSGVLKKAVWRNQCKRLVREFLRKNLVSFKPGFDVWILVQTGLPAQAGKPEFLLEANFWDKGLTRLFKKSGIYGSTSLPQDGR